jgi:TolB protein
MENQAEPAFKARGRRLAPSQRAELTIIDIDTAATTVIFTSREVIEAPNWTPDGLTLIFNAGGEIWRIAADAKSGPDRIDTGDLADLNNDHVLSPDGRLIYLSFNDGHLYVVPVEGGDPKRVSNRHETPFHYYLHGISPDGLTLAYVAIEGVGERRRINLFSIPADGGPDIRLSDIDKPNDGPDYAPDGQWIYFNSERASDRPGHAQIFRMRPDGAEVEQLTFDERVNWFPHPSPDGLKIAYLSFPPNTLGHPPDKEVILRLMGRDGGASRDLKSLFGGQGTINVNSWAPDSRRLAYVAYPLGG